MYDTHSRAGRTLRTGDPDRRAGGLAGHSAGGDMCSARLGSDRDTHSATVRPASSRALRERGETCIAVSVQSTARTKAMDIHTCNLPPRGARACVETVRASGLRRGGCAPACFRFEFEYPRRRELDKSAEDVRFGLQTATEISALRSIDTCAEATSVPSSPAPTRQPGLFLAVSACGSRAGENPDDGTQPADPALLSATPFLRVGTPPMDVFAAPSRIRSVVASWQARRVRAEWWSDARPSAQFCLLRSRVEARSIASSVWSGRATSDAIHGAEVQREGRCLACSLPLCIQRYIPVSHRLAACLHVSLASPRSEFRIAGILCTVSSVSPVPCVPHLFQLHGLHAKQTDALSLSLSLSLPLYLSLFLSLFLSLTLSLAP